VLAAVCATAAVLAAGSASGAGAKPNVLLFVTDDQTLADLYDSLGNHHRGPKLMPNTLHLIRDQGVTFDRAYSSNPLSCPSRTTIQTGQYAVNHGILANIFPDGGYCSQPGRIDLTRSLPVWMQAAGYHTLHFGRFLNGWGKGDQTRVGPGWDDWVDPVETNVSAAAIYYGYRLNEDGVVGPEYGRVGHRDRNNYFTDVLTTKAISALEGLQGSAPFYLQFDNRAPHEDVVDPVGPEPALRYARSMRGKQPPKPPSFNEADVSDKAPFLRSSRRLNPHQLKEIKRRSRRRLLALRAVDDAVARLIDALERLGELDDTYIMFVSDNGFLRGEHRFSKGKRRPYEPAVRIPLLIRGPGIPAGRTTGELVANVDIAPTIVEIAGATATREMDGRSLLPFARSPNTRTGRPILLESYFGGFAHGGKHPVGPKRLARTSAEAADPGAMAAADPTPHSWKAIVVGHWKLIRFRRGEYELYDLRHDPCELHSLANRRRFARVRRYLARQLRVLAHCHGASCRKEIAAPPEPGGLPAAKRRAGRKAST
jgi:N-acetylglucosamine-6-sulfatase